MDECRKELRQEVVDVKAMAVAKLTYVRTSNQLFNIIERC